MSERREELGQKIKDYNSAGAKMRRLEQQLADLRAACEQKQEIINSFDLVNKARREENYKLEQQLSTLRNALTIIRDGEAYLGTGDCMTATEIACEALKEQDK